MNRKPSKEIRVGAFVFAALAIVTLVVFMLGGQSRLFVRKATYRIQFRSTSGLFVGDPVVLTGVEVGNVTKIGFPRDLQEKKIVLDIAVDHAVAARIRQDTRARIGSASLIYGKVVELSMGSLDQPVIPEGGFIAAEYGSRYDAIVDSTGLMLEDARRILSKLNRGDGALGLMLNRSMELPTTLHHLSLSTQSLALLLDKMNRGQGPVGAVLTDSADYKRTLRDLQKTASDLRAVTSKLADSRTVMGKLINDAQYGDEVMKDLRSTMRSLASITAKIDTGKGTLGWLINDPELYIGLQDVVVGTQNSKIAKYLIQNRRKAGEEKRKDAIGKQQR
jgi:phospholipid/cholesterol/gamma-HCH transport system substrate-binding protein